MDPATASGGVLVVDDAKLGGIRAAMSLLQPSATLHVEPDPTGPGPHPCSQPTCAGAPFYCCDGGACEAEVCLRPSFAQPLDLVPEVTYPGQVLTSLMLELGTPPPALVPHVAGTEFELLSFFRTPGASTNYDIAMTLVADGIRVAAGTPDLPDTTGTA